MITETVYWYCVFKKLEIRIVFDVGAQTEQDTTQAIALVLLQGVRIGMQRSAVTSMHWLPYLLFLG